MEKKTKNILVYMGGRTELDNRCREIIENLPSGTNVNEFIKQAIVDSVDGKNGNDPPTGNGEINKLKAEIDYIKTEIQRMKAAVPVPINQPEPKAEQKEETSETENKIDSLFDAF